MSHARGAGNWTSSCPFGQSFRTVPSSHLEASQAKGQGVKVALSGRKAEGLALGVTTVLVKPVL